MSSSPSSTESAVSTSSSSPPPAAPAPVAPPTPEVGCAKRKRKLQAPAPCWGQELCPNLVCPVVSGGKGAFREHFCERCRMEDLSVVTSRVYLPIIEVPPNSRTTGFWNEPARPARCARIWWPAHRVCNQTSDSVGPRLVILRDDYATPPPGLVPITSLLPSLGGRVVFRVSRTLTPVSWLPSSLPGTSTLAAELTAGQLRQLTSTPPPPPPSLLPPSAAAALRARPGHVQDTSTARIAWASSSAPAPAPVRAAPRLRARDTLHKTV